MSDAMESANLAYQIHMGMTVADAPTMDAHRDVALAFEAGWHAAYEQAALMAVSMIDNEPDGYYGQACSEIASALRADKHAG